MSTNALTQKLFSLADEKYRNFHSALMPTIDKSTVMGIRIPVLRKFAKEFAKTDGAKSFMNELPHKYYEENNLHAFLIEKIRDFDDAVRELDLFLPYVDNWATCDMMNPAVLGKNKEKLAEKIKEWLAEDGCYVKRFGIGMLMRHFLDGDYKKEYLEAVAAIQSDEYYVNMMRAWFFATALAKRYEDTVPYLENYRLDAWTHNKTVQKAVESYRISTDKKEYLKTLRVKGKGKDG